MRVWGRQVLRGMSARISGALTFSAGRCGTIPVGGADTAPGALTPGPLHATAPGCAEDGLNRASLDENSGWSGRGAFVGSCPNRIRRGVGRGAASPPAGVCTGVQEPSRSQHEDVERDLMGEVDTARGCTP